MTKTLYGIKACDTMKKARNWLDDKGIAYDFHDYKKEGVPAERLKAWAAKAGWEKLCNSRGPTWRKIPDAEKVGLDEQKALRLLCKYPSAIKRPVAEAGVRLQVGFEPDAFSRLLK